MEQVRQSSSKKTTREETFAQAYSQTPWRKQLQGIVTFLLIVVSTALVAGIYLSVTSQAATLGRQIQDMQIRMEGSERLDLAFADSTVLEKEAAAGSRISLIEMVPIEELRIQIADLQGQLAENLSSTVMRERAERMGFVPSNPEEMIYFKVPGYQGKQLAHLAPPPAPVAVNTAVLPPAFRESLIDWLGHQVNLVSRSWLQEVKP